MTHDDPIVGFRQDRIGARLICLLNVMRLARKLGQPGRFLWLSDPRGPYPELADPCDFLAPDFVARHIIVIAQPPDLRGRGNLRTLARRQSVAGCARALAGGARHECDPMAEAIRFMDESPDAVAAELRGVAAELALSEPLLAALERAQARLAEAGGGDPVAIHVRRGDILDGTPWSHAFWSEKYVPDEFFRAFVAKAGGPVIAFSDTPAAVAHLAQGCARILPVADLVGDAALSPAGRDLVELLLMAGCAQVGAPAQSAFSQAAAVVGGCRITALPHALPEAARQTAHSRLRERAITRPESFFAPGDLAQSLGHAARHAVSTGDGAELVAAFAGGQAFLQRFPFLHAELAIAALGSGLPDQARHLAEAGLQAPLIRHRDKSLCQQVLLAERFKAKGDAAAAAEAELVGMILTGHRAHGPLVPGLARRALSRPGRAQRELLLDPALARLLAQPQQIAGQGPVLPLWVPRSDWGELFHDPRLQGELLLAPDLRHKLAPAAEGLARIEAALAAGEAPPLPEDAASRLGFCAAQLRLHGRLRRAFALLRWLDDQAPGQALTHKRLADACFAAGNARAGGRWLGSALALAPDNAMLHLSAAVRAAEAGRKDAAAAHLHKAQSAWPELGLVRVLRRKLLRERAG